MCRLVFARKRDHHFMRGERMVRQLQVQGGLQIWLNSKEVPCSYFSRVNDVRTSLAVGEVKSVEKMKKV